MSNGENTPTNENTCENEKNENENKKKKETKKKEDEVEKKVEINLNKLDDFPYEVLPNETQEYDLSFKVIVIGDSGKKII